LYTQQTSAPWTPLLIAAALAFNIGHYFLIHSPCLRSPFYLVHGLVVLPVSLAAAALTHRSEVRARRAFAGTLAAKNRGEEPGGRAGRSKDD
jgi:hypothetical protein